MQVFLVRSRINLNLYAAKTMARGYHKFEAAMKVEKRVLALGRQCLFLTSLHDSFSTSVSE